MYIQYVIIGFRPHDLPNIALQAQKTLWAFFNNMLYVLFPGQSFVQY